MRFTLFTIVVVLLCKTSYAQEHKQDINWQPFSNKAFEVASKQKKPILLNLEANWCHWCHVMHNTTYSDPTVVAYLNKHFICLKADQDQHPDLSQRYREYGWPATVFINAKGEDILKRAGYIAPKDFLRLLKAVIKDPSPEVLERSLASIEVGDTEKSSVLKDLESRFHNTLDYNLGAQDFEQKYVEYDSYEYALFFDGDVKVRKWANTTATYATKLCDPAWGGVYQYSTHGDWEHVHFEKLLAVQARYVHVFAYDYLYSNNLQSLTNAKKIVEYANRFLFNKKDRLYNSAQDADLVAGEHSETYFKSSGEEREKLGIPRVDQNTYTNSNADMIAALVQLYHTTNDTSYKEMATNLFASLENRKTATGLFKHDNTASVLSLKDNISMAKALKALASLKIIDSQYNATLKLLIDGIVNGFSLPNGSLKSFIGNTGLQAEPLINENIDAARILNWYSYYSKDTSYKKHSEKIFLFLTTPSVAQSYYNEPAILALKSELDREPDQIVYVTYTKPLKDNVFSKAKAMAPFYSIAAMYANTEIPYDKKSLFEGFNQNVLLVCTSTTCSSPIYAEDDVSALFSKKPIKQSLFSN